MNTLKYNIHSEIEIEATPQQVWEVFGDFAGWGSWNDFVVLPVVPERVGKRCRAVFYLESGCMKQTSHDPEVCADCGLCCSTLRIHHSLLTGSSSSSSSVLVGHKQDEALLKTTMELMGNVVYPRQTLHSTVSNMCCAGLHAAHTPLPCALLPLLFTQRMHCCCCCCCRSWCLRRTRSCAGVITGAH